MVNERKFRLPKDIPMEEYPKPETYLEEAHHLTEDAQKQGMLLRVMGPIALHFYFPEHVDLYRRMERLGDSPMNNSYPGYLGYICNWAEARLIKR